MLGRLLGMSSPESASYVRRQLFVHVSISLSTTSQALPRHRYLTQILPRLVKLAQDTVPNVRISFARDAWMLPVWLLEEPSVAEALVCLCGDGHEDVRGYMYKGREKRVDGALEAIFEKVPPPPPTPPAAPVVDAHTHTHTWTWTWTWLSG